MGLEDPLGSSRDARYELLTAMAPAFFAGDSGDGTVRGDLAEILSQVRPAEVMPWYRGLTPDFFDWLERS